MTQTKAASAAAKSSGSSALAEGSFEIDRVVDVRRDKRGNNAITVEPAIGKLARLTIMLNEFIGQ